ncbi:S-adenosyl-L-methionine-dependent methyltransferase [Halteromyces radiatus]|uniref:S-adenosyl-L-methionine-dependent methyltransferase n=1 Tax=Halteromyces radiatus TaxID=101107 RepID=UPI0022208258|nr:S-adenosyl-L-methionine-dependent methyltransferase [Halteromyces radiatus]KAI8093562.1 S-adenosyl-L-methionine-dependent methyltransferase [Halteromyces radiatus]
MTLEQQPHQTASNGFQSGSAYYELSRPKYPLESIDFIKTIIPVNGKVVDLGAGTGIMTKFLVEVCQYQVTAVEPVEGMREKLLAAVPGVKAVNGTSWNTTLPSNSQDAVIVAQAFHWFDDLKSLQEIHRILKPEGHLLLIWNMESKKNCRWVEELRNLYEFYDAAAPQYRKNQWQNVWATKEASDLFNVPLQHKQFDYPMPFIRQRIFPRILSKSYIAILPKSEQDELEKKVNAVLNNPEYGFDADPVTGEFIYPHDTDLYWTQKK